MRYQTIATGLRRGQELTFLAYGTKAQPKAYIEGRGLRYWTPVGQPIVQPIANPWPRPKAQPIAQPMVQPKAYPYSPIVDQGSGVFVERTLFGKWLIRLGFPAKRHTRPMATRVQRRVVYSPHPEQTRVQPLAGAEKPTADEASVFRGYIIIRTLFGKLLITKEIGPQCS